MTKLTSSVILEAIQQEQQHLAWLALKPLPLADYLKIEGILQV